jgi:hypothetical protein
MNWASNSSFEDPHHLDQYALPVLAVQCGADQNDYVLAQFDAPQIDLPPQRLAEDVAEAEPTLRVLHAAQRAQEVGQLQQQ